MRTVVVGLAVAVGLSGSAARAAPPPDGAQFNMMGGARCSAWPKSGDIGAPAKAVPLNWALGYLSGAAMEGDPNLLTLTDPETVDAWMSAFCKDNPQVSLPTAVQALQAALEAKLPPRAPMFSPAVAAKPEAKAAAADKPPEAAAKPKRRKVVRKKTPVAAATAPAKAPAPSAPANANAPMKTGPRP